MSGEALERLAACHRRIEAQLGLLETLAVQVAAARPDAALQAAAAEMVRYFDTEGAQHHRDEDGDLFPLLRKLAAASGRGEVSAAIDELEREHATMDSQWARLRDKLAAVAGGRSTAFGEGEVERFAWLYRRHLDRENLLVLPFAEEALSTAERGSLAQRMSARRAAAQ